MKKAKGSKDNFKIEKLTCFPLLFLRELLAKTSCYKISSSPQEAYCCQANVQLCLLSTICSSNINTSAKTDESRAYSSITELALLQKSFTCDDQKQALNVSNYHQLAKLNISMDTSFLKCKYSELNS